jgi:steroid 5-alpha reductase family enzyme
VSQSERGFATMDSRRLIPAIECNDQTLLVFGLVYVARLYFAMLVLWSRPPDWHEIPIVYVFFIPSIFYTMARGKIDECSAPVTAVAIALYVVGSGFSTIGEYQRYVFKKQPANKGKLMTGGLWSITMHANYFGDTLLFTGWTLASSGLAVSWTWWAVPVMTALFVFMHIPGLDEYLADRYPKEFPKYAATTAKFIPYIY